MLIPLKYNVAVKFEKVLALSSVLLQNERPISDPFSKFRG